MRTLVAYLTADVGEYLIAKIIIASITIVCTTVVALTLAAALWCGIAELPTIAILVYAALLGGHAFMAKYTFNHMQEAIEIEVE